jgi:hypothetical protein
VTTPRIPLLILTALLAVPAFPHSAIAGAPQRAVETCRGQTATIVGSDAQRELAGTPGNDVIVTNGSQIIDSGAGDDVICTVRSQVPEPPNQPNNRVNAGPGDDVIDLSSDAEDADFLVFPAEGADTVYGGPGKDLISDTGDDNQADVYSAGAGDDFVSSTGGEDVIDLGPGRDTFDPGHEVDDQVSVLGGDGTDSLYLGKVGKQGSPWLFDNNREVIDRDGALFFAFDGFETFNAWGEADVELSFVGSDQADFLGISGIADFGRVDLGGGDDSFSYGSAPRVPVRFEHGLDGGDGRDSFFAGGTDTDVELDLLRGSLRLSGGRATRLSAVTGIEDASAIGDRVVLRGDAGPNTLRWWGCGGSVRGRAGNDVLSWTEKEGGTCRGKGRLRARGDQGDDVLVGGPVDDVLIGGPGTDSARGGKGRDSCDAEVQVSCR